MCFIAKTRVLKKFYITSDTVPYLYEGTQGSVSSEEEFGAADRLQALLLMFL